MAHFDLENYFSHMFERIRLDVQGRRREDRALNVFNGIEFALV